MGEELKEERTITIKDAVQELEDLRKSTVISFITNLPGIINAHCVMLLADNLEKVKPRFRNDKSNKKFGRLDLFVNSNGGSIDSAFKVVNLCREFAEEFNVIVPLIAKSAATLICLGADKIVMPPISELGPLDPIINHPSTGDPIPARAIQDFLALASRRDSTSGTEFSDVLSPLIDKLDPWIIGSYETALRIAEDYAYRLLSEHMLKDNPEKAREVARVLAKEIPSHHYAIGRKEAAEKYNLAIQNVDPPDDIHESIRKLLLVYTNYMVQNQIVVLSGTRDINRFAKAVTSPAKKSPEVRGML